MNWLLNLFKKKKNICPPDCPKGGECPRKIYVRGNGAMGVENFFQCAKFQESIRNSASNSI